MIWRWARAAGVKAIGILPPGINGELRELLIEHGAEKVLDNINDLVNVI